MLSYVTHFVLLSALNLPFADTLSVPLEWFSGQHVAVQAFTLIFGILGFYLLLRIVFKIVEKIAGLVG